ncbi:MAG: RNA polymerase sigma factor [Nonlabens sp.]
MTDSKEQEILDKIADPQSREEGYRILLNTYQQHIYWQVRKMVLSHDDTHDVVQNVFIKVFKGLKNFKGHSKLSTWLYRIAYNESITFLNKRSKQLKISDQELALKMTDDLVADAHFTAGEVELALQRALAALPARQRQIFNYRYFDELKFKDIAAVLDLSEGAVKSSYHIAAKKIESHIKSH